MEPVLAASTSGVGFGGLLRFLKFASDDMVCRIQCDGDRTDGKMFEMKEVFTQDRKVSWYEKNKEAVRYHDGKGIVQKYPIQSPKSKHI